MKIALCGSLSFKEEIKSLVSQIEKFGHLEVSGFAGSVSRTDPIREWYEVIQKSDAILVCNLDKKGIKNYIGGNVFLEIGFAFVSNKKIFLLNPIPEVSYKEEIIEMNPVVLDGDLSKIG